MRMIISCDACTWVVMRYYVRVQAERALMRRNTKQFGDGWDARAERGGSAGRKMRKDRCSAAGMVRSVKCRRHQKKALPGGELKPKRGFRQVRGDCSKSLDARLRQLASRYLSFRKPDDDRLQSCAQACERRADGRGIQLSSPDVCAGACDGSMWPSLLALVAR